MSEKTPMTAQDRASLAFSLYQDSVPWPILVSRVASASGLERCYNEASAKHDLWHYAQKKPQRRHTLDTDGCRSYLEMHREAYSEEGYSDIMVAATARAYADIEWGRPCSFGVCYPIRRDDVSRCGRTADGGEQHSCASDAYAWFTSMEFPELCDTMDWCWSRHMEVVLREASVTMGLYPFLALVPALVWRIACILTGEAGGMGPQGIYLVADTMLSRKALGQTWDVVLSAYYGYREPPSEDAMRLANGMLNHPWKPSGRLYAYSDADRLKMSWPRGEIVYAINGLTLHLRSSLAPLLTAAQPLR